MKPWRWFKNYWWTILAILALLSLLVWITSVVIKAEKKNAQDLKTCIAADYMGTATVMQETICYGYIDGNRLVVVPVADIEDGQ